MRFCLTIALLLLAVINLPVAQPVGELTGKILDSDTRTPIQNARMSIADLGELVTTDRDGIYLFTQLPAGNYVLSVEADGYRSYTERGILIRTGQLTQRNILLEPAVPRLDSVVVQTQRPAQTGNTHVEALSQEMIQKRAVTTFDQAMDIVSGIQIQRSQTAVVQSLSVRGSSDVAGGGIGNRVLLLIDGRPALSPESGGALWAIVPINSVDRVEVAKGAASSLYGSSAMGGVINVITKKPGEQSHLTLHTNLGVYELPNTQYTDSTPLLGTTEAQASFRRGRWGALFSLGRKSSDGHSEQSAYTLHNVYAKTDYEIDKDREIRFTLGLNALDNDYPHSWISRLQPLQVIPKYGDDRQSKRELSADLYYHAIANTRTKYSSRFYFYRNRAASYFNEDDPLLERRANHPYQFRTHVDAQRLGHLTQMDVFLQDQHYVITGIDVQLDRVDSTPEDVLYGNHDAWNFAWYGQYEWRPTQRFSATAGLRYDRNQLVDGPRLSRFSPRISASYRLFPQWKLRALSGQAFRSPSIAERFFEKELASGIDFLPNPDLRAERLTQSHEVGITWAPTPQLNLDAAYYYNRYEDLIYWADLSAGLGLPYGTLFQVRNLNEALMHGVDVSLRGNWRQWLTFQVGYAYLDAEDRSPNRVNDTLAYKIRHSFTYLLAVSRNSWRATLSGRYRGRVEEVFLWPNDEPDAFHVHNLRVSHTRERLEVYLAVNNLFAVQYEELARYRMPGRHWTTGLRARF